MASRVGLKADLQGVLNPFSLPTLARVGHPAPMLLTPFVSRLQDTCPSLRQVLLALTGAVPASYPAAYVLPLADSATPSRLHGVHSQMVTARFGVEIMVKHAGQAASGGPAGEALEVVRNEIRAALMGWCPGPEFEPVTYVSGRLVNFEAGLAVWREEYSTRFEQRIYPTA